MYLLLTASNSFENGELQLLNKMLVTPAYCQSLAYAFDTGHLENRTGAHPQEFSVGWESQRCEE